jgi:BlaI family penicillinase repressor
MSEITLSEQGDTRSLFRKSNIFVTVKEVFPVNKLPQISEAEFEVMKIIWSHAPINTNEITKHLLQTTNWSPKTIQTLIKRLVTKGALAYEKQGRVFVYTPLVNENEYIGQESHSFLNRFYHGDLTAMVSSYIENDKLSDAEIEQLRSLLSQKSKKGNR